MLRLMLYTLEKFFVLISLFLLSGALLPLWRQMSGFDLSFVEGDPIQQAIFATIYAISFLLLLLRPRRTLKVLHAGIYLWPFLGWTLLSVFWSQIPEVTIRREITLLGTTMFGIYLASRFEQREFLRLLGWTLLILVVLSYFFILLMPEWGIMEEARGAAWRGIYVHKNALGRVAAFATVVFYLLAKSRTRRSYVWWCGLILAIGLVVGSRSVTSLVVLFMLLFLIPLINVLRWRYDLAIPSFLMFILVAGTLTWIVSTRIETILVILGRDATLTGRTHIWKAVFFVASQQPWMGYGYYGSFWPGWGEPFDVIQYSTSSFYVLNSHNSFLDLLLELGCIGLALFVLSYLTTFVRAFKMMKKNGEYFIVWPALYLLFILLNSIDESAILLPNNILWVLYVYVALIVSRWSYANYVRKRRLYS